MSALRVQPFDDPTWDPAAALGQFLGVGVVLDPYPQVAELRKRSPVHKIDMRRHLGALPDILVEDLLRLDPEQPPPQIVGINGRAPSAVHARFG